MLSASHQPGTEGGMAFWPVTSSLFSTIASLSASPWESVIRMESRRELRQGQQHSKDLKKAGNQAARGMVRSAVGHCLPLSTQII